MPNFVRRVIVGAIAALGAGLSAAPAAAQADEISVVSFNIQFLGSSTKRDNAALTNLLADYDLVFVQEVIAPPYDGEFPDGDPYRPDRQVAEFFDPVVAQLARGSRVDILEGSEGWARVAGGWVASAYLSAAEPAAPTLSDVRIRSMIIEQSLRSYYGSCPCPYNVDRSGRRCGGRLASKGGVHNLGLGHSEPSG